MKIHMQSNQVLRWFTQ